MPYALANRSTRARWAATPSGFWPNNTNRLYETDDPYGFPIVASTPGFEPVKLIPFTEARTRSVVKRRAAVHFFLDDYQFDVIWRKPQRTSAVLKHFAGALSPTFSIASAAPYALNVFNLYRSRWFTRYLQECGIPVLVDVRWADAATYDYAFSGIERGSAVIVSTVGTRALVNRGLFLDGFEVMLRRIEPARLFVYGEYMPVKFEDYADGVHVYPSYWAEKRHATSEPKRSLHYPAG